MTIGGFARAGVVVALMMLTAACPKNPDLSGFLTQATAMGGEVGAEFDAVQAQFQAAIGSYSDIPSPDRSLQKNQNMLKKAHKEVKALDEASSQLLDKIVAYTDDLVALVEAGKKDQEATKRIMDSLAAIANLSFPGAGSAVGTALEEVATAVSNIQVNAGLRKAVMQAQPAVEASRDALLAIFDTKWDRMIDALADSYDSYEKARTGEGTVSFYKTAVFKRSELHSDLQGGLARDVCSDGAKSESFCLDEDKVERLKFLEERIAKTEPTVRDYLAKRESLEAWQSLHITKAELIRKTIKAWAAEHKKIALKLQDCGSTTFDGCFEAPAYSMKSLLDRMKLINDTKS